MWVWYKMGKREARLRRTSLVVTEATELRDKGRSSGSRGK